MKTAKTDGTKLRRWYEKNAADYFFRQKPQTYTTWVSEIMLQQTRMQVVLPKLSAFIEIFPTVQDLARAKEDQVLAAWQGLGYYSRARNLHRAAQQIVNLYGNNWPTTEAQWLDLPGIGPYTAAAISSIAFGQAAIVVDGNVKRIYSRLFATTELNDSSLKAELKIFYGPKNYADTNQALMDLGRFICLPKNPKCRECPLSTSCRAFAENRIAEFPPPKPKPDKIQLDMYIHLIFCQDQVLLLEHTKEAFLKKQLFPPYTTEPKNKISKTNKSKDRYLFQPPVLDVLVPANGMELHAPPFKHSITHHDITCRLQGHRIERDLLPIIEAETSRPVWSSIPDLKEFMFSSLAGKIQKAMATAQSGLFSD